MANDINIAIEQLSEDDSDISSNVLLLAYHGDKNF